LTAIWSWMLILSMNHQLPVAKCQSHFFTNNLQ
jgi:hypothetical protein